MTPDVSLPITPDTLHAANERIAAFILAHTDTSRDDRLWPAFFRLFSTNPLNLAYGASGTALFLHETQGAVPEEAIAWMLERPVSLDDYPPGLFVGLAGIAYAWLELGLREPAEAMMQLAYASPLRFAEANLMFGSAGWGLASLDFYHKTQDRTYLDAAIEAGAHLVETAIAQEDGTCAWRYNSLDAVHHGYGYGASGIALFLLYLARYTGDATFLEYARKGIDYDLARGVETELGTRWGRYEGDALSLPYWLHGNAGVGAVALRFYQQLGEAAYLTAAERAAEGADVCLSVLSCLFEGLSGIAEFMLDLYQVTEQPRYLEKAHAMTESVFCFAIERPEGLAFPGRWNNRLCTDFATGSAGVGLFLHRLATGGPRRFLDLPTPDALSAAEPPPAALELAR